MSVEIYPVVHYLDRHQALDESGLAFDLGADGVYLIDHSYGGGLGSLLNSMMTVKGQHPDKFVGVNFLGVPPNKLFNWFGTIHDKYNIPLPDGIWADNADQRARSTVRERQVNPALQGIRYLGGVSFKYQKGYSDKPGPAAREAARLAPFVDVVTTSGPGTGHAAPAEKLQAMKEAIGEQRLAVASGVSIENIAQCAPHVDEILVSSSVEIRHGQFSPLKLGRLIEAAHSF